MIMDSSGEPAFSGWTEQSSTEPVSPASIGDKVLSAALHVKSKAEVAPEDKLREHLLGFIGQKSAFEEMIFREHGMACGTFNFKGEKMDFEGSETLQVSPCRDEFWALGPEAAVDTVCSIASRYGIGPDEVFVGVWPDNNGKLGSEVSFNVPISRWPIADAIMVKYNQEVVLDWRFSPDDMERAYIRNPYYKKGALVNYGQASPNIRSGKNG